MFRSHSMEFCQLIIPREQGYEALNRLGQLDCVELVEKEDKNFQKGFNNQIKRCDEMLDKLNYLMAEINKQQELEDVTDFELVLEYFDKLMTNKSQHQYLDQLEDYIASKYQFMKEQQDTLERLRDKRLQLQDEKQGLLLSREWLGNKYFGGQQDQQDLEMNNVNNVMMLPQQRFKNIIGIINIQDFLQFSRTIFRITKNNFSMNNHQISNDKTCFLLIYPSALLSSEIHNKVMRVCDNYSIQRIALPVNDEQWDQQYQGYDTQTTEIDNLVTLTLNIIKQQIPILLNNSAYPSIQYIRLYVVREKYLYQNLNLMNMQSSLFTCKLWLKSTFKDSIQSKILYGQLHFLSPHAHNPPTFFKTNQFNQLFQQIVYTYGIPRYKEINPTIFTIVTFPFLFAVMFGDFYHGLAILLFGLYLSYTKSFSPRSILKQQRQQRIKQGLQAGAQEDVDSQSSLQIIYDLRYIFILCGAFSMYVGIIYNEYAGFQMDIFQSGFGLQPEFAHSLNFSNSFKMKLSIILGYCQMTLGIFIYAVNQLYHRNLTNLLFVFPAKLVFFTSTIGYLVFLIVYKWNIHWESSEAPSIITTFVNMFLHAGDYGDLPMFSNQQMIQVILLVLTIISIPFMLLPPIVKDVNSFRSGEFQSVSHEFNSLGDIVVHHVIEAIEFILGTISNTASYLRLWALSLAHSQLAAVFYSLTLASHVQTGSWVGLVIMFPLYAGVITGVLLIMDAMECFLHALRLHWVEFQNKFFHGDGHLFQSFSFTREMKQYQDKHRFL